MNFGPCEGAGGAGGAFEGSGIKERDVHHVISCPVEIQFAPQERFDGRDVNTMSCVVFRLCLRCLFQECHADNTMFVPVEI